TKPIKTIITKMSEYRAPLWNDSKMFFRNTSDVTFAILPKNQTKKNITKNQLPIKTIIFEILPFIGITF
ncbi:MAG: hypothetical protein RQ930_03985, partial [Candidatus Aenigmarchaeota archaeon]|nr:hypothetical protein [Candidatus Aenigmarchaeota archaeon]